MSAPNLSQLRLLSKALSYLRCADYAPYLTLKRLFLARQDRYRAQFCHEFALFYGLNAGGLTEAFKKRYFELLFGLRIQEGVDPYTPILTELYAIPRRQGDKALQCSFVSKLVAMHDETRPLYDQHVSAFFGITVPPNPRVEVRITRFVADLERLRQTYGGWSQDEQFQHVLQRLITQHPALKDCASTRLADFLVWTVGRNKLGSPRVREPRE
jgi:hypothetical protein